MPLDSQCEIASLEKMTTGELQARYAEVFGETSRSRHKRYLIRKIIWRMQANAEGDLSERARQRAAELAVDAEARTTPPKDFTASQIPKAGSHDPRLPAPGTSIVRQYKDGEIEVRVLKNGFEWEGDRYHSLSAVAKAVTGSHCNGFRFFNLEAK